MQIDIINIPPTTTKNLLFVGLILLLTSPAFALGSDARNLLLIGAMGLSPLIFILIPAITRTAIYLYIIIILSILCPLINHPETMRWSTVLYGCMFNLYFIALSTLLAFSRVSQNDIIKLLKFLLLAYTITLLIQQTCVLLGIPIFNVSNYNIRQPWKLNSLMSEPEHSGRMIALLMYAYLSIKSIKAGKESLIESWKEDKLIWSAFLWCMLTSLSAGAYLFLFIVLSKFLTVKNCLKVTGITLIFLLIINALFEPTALNRFIKFFFAILTFDLDMIYQVDQSAALRIVPSILCIQKINLLSIDGWFGCGVDYVSRFMSDYLPGVENGYTGGGMFLYAVEYGFLAFIVLSVVSFRLCYDRDNIIPTILFWIFSVLLVGINSQLSWSTIMMLYIVKYCKLINSDNEYISTGISSITK